jgi:hypothetical protein
MEALLTKGLHGNYVLPMKKYAPGIKKRLIMPTHAGKVDV